MNIEVGSEVNIELLKLTLKLAAKLTSKFSIEVNLEVGSKVNIEVQLSALKWTLELWSWHLTAMLTSIIELLKFSVEELINLTVGSDVNIGLLKFIIEVNSEEIEVEHRS